MENKMLETQKLLELQKVMSTNDATIVGVLIVIVVAFGWVIFYLFKVNQDLHNKFIVELKASNEALIKVNNFQNDFVNNLARMDKR